MITELLQSAKGKKEQQQLEFIISTVEILETTKNDWIVAGLSLQALRQKGITLPLSDALIATIASRHSVSVLTIDKHFGYLPVTILDSLAQ